MQNQTISSLDQLFNDTTEQQTLGNIGKVREDFSKLPQEHTILYSRLSFIMIATNLNRMRLVDLGSVWVTIVREKKTFYIDGLPVSKKGSLTEVISELVSLIQSGVRVRYIPTDIHEKLICLDSGINNAGYMHAWPQYFIDKTLFDIDSPKSKGYRRVIHSFDKYEERSKDFITEHDKLTYEDLKPIIGIWDDWANRQDGRQSFDKDNARNIVINLANIQKAHISYTITRIFDGMKLIAYSICDRLRNDLHFSVEAKSLPNTGDINKLTLYDEIQNTTRFLNIGGGDYLKPYNDTKALSDRSNDLYTLPLNMGKYYQRPTNIYLVYMYNDIPNKKYKKVNGLW